MKSFFPGLKLKSEPPKISKENEAVNIELGELKFPANKDLETVQVE